MIKERDLQGESALVIERMDYACQLKWRERDGTGDFVEPERSFLPTMLGYVIFDSGKSTEGL
ncbi:hypothetical protein EBA31_05315 [Serratia sp. P2ACOL2]|nr:hypothetical protein EBA31_05315 [Serratia sp. P2ACOL2]